MLDSCRRAAPCALLVAALAWACEDDETRPGRAPDCNDPGCLDARGGSFSRPLPTGPGSGGGAGGAGGSTGAEAQLSGSVLEISSQDLLTAQGVSAAVEVRAASADGGDDVRVVTGVDGTYRLDGIVRDDGVWVGVGRFEDPPVEPFIDTLQVVDSRRLGETDLLVVRTEVLRELAQTSFLNQTVELSLERAHLVLRFVDSDERPVEGVQITFPSPDNVATAYDAGDSYSDALPTTSVRGMAVLLNLDAPAWPGSPLAIVADLDGDRLSAEVQLVRGAVSVVDAVIPDP